MANWGFSYRAPAMLGYESEKVSGPSFPCGQQSPNMVWRAPLLLSGTFLPDTSSTRPTPTPAHGSSSALPTPTENICEGDTVRIKRQGSAGFVDERDAATTLPAELALTMLYSKLPCPRINTNDDIKKITQCWLHHSIRKKKKKLKRKFTSRPRLAENSKLCCLLQDFDV